MDTVTLFATGTFPRTHWNYNCNFPQLFAKFLIRPLTVYNINTFEEKVFFLWRPIPVRKNTQKRNQLVGMSGFRLLMSWKLSMQSFMLLRLDSQFFHLFIGLKQIE